MNWPAAVAIVGSVWALAWMVRCLAAASTAASDAAAEAMRTLREPDS